MTHLHSFVSYVFSALMKQNCVLEFKVYIHLVLKSNPIVRIIIDASSLEHPSLHCSSLDLKSFDSASYPRVKMMVKLQNLAYKEPFIVER